MAFKAKFPIISFPRTLQGLIKAFESLNNTLATYWGGLVVDSPIVVGKIVTGVNLTSSWTKVAHGLGRTPSGGVLLFSNNAGATVVAYKNGSGTHEPDSQYIWIYSTSPSAGSYVDLLVF